jgi:hypothetical protein
MPKKFTYYGTNGIDPDALAFFVATGITEPSLKEALNTLVKTLKSEGVWSKQKAIYPMATDQNNSLTYTEDLTNATIYSNGLNVITQPVVTPPTGVTTVNKITPTAVSGIHYVTTQTSVLGYEGVTFSVYVKAAGYNWVRVALDFSTEYHRFWFDLQNGVFGADNGTATLVSKKATALANGWYRLEMTCTTASPYGTLCFIAAQTADNETTMTGDATSGIYASGLQLERSLIDATAYEPVLANSVMQQQMKYNLKDPRDLDAAFRLDFVNRWGFSKFGANTYPPQQVYANTFLIPNTTLSLNSTHLSYYSRWEANGLNFEMGVFQGAGSLHMGVLYSVQGMRVRVNSTTPTTTYIPASSKGFFIGNRRSSTQVTLYKNGVLQATETNNSDSLSSTLPISIGALTNAGPIRDQFTQKECAFASIGDGLTDAEALAYYNAVQTFNTTLNRQV